MSLIKKGLYRHYKGNNYEVIDVARHSETEEWMVIYRALYESEFGQDVLWVRPLTMFKEQVTVEGQEQPRFAFLGENSHQNP